MSLISHPMLRVGVHGLFIIIALCGAVPVAAEEMPASFLEALPRKEVDVAEELRLLIERLEEADVPEDRVHGIQQLSQLLPLDATFTARLETLLRKTIDESDTPQLLSIASTAAHFPSLHEKLLRKIDEPKAKDIALWQFAMVDPDFEHARQYAKEIKSPRRRGNALQKLSQRATSLDNQLDLLEELFSLKGEDDVLMGAKVSVLQSHAAKHPRRICDFIARHITADDAMYVYTSFAQRANRVSPEAAKAYMDAAWSRIDHTAKPHLHVPKLLANGPRDVDRQTWVSEFDQYVLPALVAAETSIEPLADLARFDIDLVIDRTTRSCVHPARPFSDIFPLVMRRAFHVNPEAVLSWLERRDSEHTSECVVRITEYLSSRRSRGLGGQDLAPDRPLYLQRLCDLALALEPPEKRLLALTFLAEEMPRMGIAVPNQVLEEGRVLLSEHLPIMEIGLWSDERKFLSLATPEERRQIAETHVQKLLDASNLPERHEFHQLCAFVTESGFPRDEQLAMLRRMYSIATRHADRYLQVVAGRAMVKVDAPTAVRMVWKTMPKNRGGGEKRMYLDWIPPPVDAEDAVNWLRDGVGGDDNEAELLMALWDFLPSTPTADRDDILVALCHSLTAHGHFEHALGVAEQLRDPRSRNESLIRLLREIDTTQ